MKEETAMQKTNLRYGHSDGRGDGRDTHKRLPSLPT